MVTKLKYGEEGFTIVADDTADLLKVFDHVTEGPQVVEVRTGANVEGPSPWAAKRITGTVDQIVKEIISDVNEQFADDAPVSVGPLIGEELHSEPEWFEWNQPLYEGCGGPVGIENGTTLKVRLRNGTEMNIVMGTLHSYWRNDDTAVDIIAYRVIA